MSISLHPRDFIMGGLIQDVDVEVVEARFIATDYDRTLPSATALALKLDLKVLGDETNTIHTQLFAAGSTANFAPDPETNGRTLEKNGSREALDKNSNLGLFLQSMVDCEANLSPLAKGDISVLEGARFHIVRKPAPKREGLASTVTRGDGQEREKTIVLCSKILSLPWDKKGAGGGKASAAAAPATGRGKTQAQAPPEPDGDEGDESPYPADQLEKASDFITALVVDSGNALPVKQAKLKMLKALKDLGVRGGPDGQKFIEYVLAPAFLSSVGLVVAEDHIQVE
jgi:hypothetical protein